MHKQVKIFVKDDSVFVEYNVERCSQCSLPDTFPDIHFAPGKRCNYCKDETSYLQLENRDKLIETVLEIAKNQGTNKSEHDCLALYSGGKDSSYSLYILKKVLGLNPLAFTLDNGFVADSTFPNMQRVLNSLDIDHVVHKPQQDLMNLVYNSSIKNKQSDQNIKYATKGCGACISLVLASAAGECIERKIPLMAGGWSPGQLTNSCLLPGAFLEKICSHHFTSIQINTPEIQRKLARYQRCSSVIPPLFNPLYLYRYSEGDIIKKLRSVGWQPPENVDSCSTNCQLNGFLVIDHILQYGFHPYEYELAFHVRNGFMKKDEVLDKIGNINVTLSQLKLVQNRLGITSALELFEEIDRE